MKANRIIITFLLVLPIVFPTHLFAQNHTLQGFVRDATTDEPLIGATVFQPASQKGTSTDNNGYFRLTTSAKATLEISFIGYQKLLFANPAQNDSLVNLYLAPGLSIGEVKIEAKHTEERVTGLVEIPIDLLKKLPTMTGEPDLMKSFQLMPGVKMGDEGTSVFYVRGGTPDQNLILMDDVPLYYVNHIGGFLSVFDMNTIKKATLYKGDFPPRFGGRLSSVLDIRLKDGNVNQSKHEIGVGTLSSKYFVEGPILKNKLSGMFSLRRCNLDLFMRPLTEMNSSGNDVRSYSFYDLTAKATYTKDARNKFSFMAYSGRDKLFFKEKFADNYLDKMNNRWGNRIGSAKWTHFSKNSWVATSGVSYSRFFRLISTIEKEASQNDANKTVGSFGSSIQDLSIFSSVNRPFNKLDLRLGLSSTFHQFTPTAIKSSGGGNSSEEDTLFINRLHETELSGYLETDWDISKKLHISSGFFAMYWLGIDHASIDPRLSVNYSLPNETAIKASYSKNHQYIHLLANNSAGLPNDLWVPSTSSIQPEKSDQIALALSRNVNGIDFSIETYYKKMLNLIYYKPGFTVFNTLNWQDAIEKAGEGTSKGIELLIQKNTGKQRGWIGYTLSKDTRQFEALNDGRVFPFKYGRLHEVNVVYNLEISSKVSFSANWIFASGNYITLATQTFPAIDFDYFRDNYFDKTFVDAHNYGGVNYYKTASYHRLDIGLNFKKQLKKGERNFYFGIYNLYNRMNPYYYYFKSSGGSRKLYQFSLFPIMPSVSFTYKW